MASKDTTFDPDGDVILILEEKPATLDVPVEPSLSGEKSKKGSRVSARASPYPAPKKLNQVRMRVSSRHMMLASKVFKAMLNRGFQEGEALKVNGSVEIPLPDDDPTAFTILMDIVHGRSRKVPRAVAFPLLTALSILVDKYDLLEAVEVYSDAWILDLQSTIPKEFTPEVLPWMSVSWVFRRAPEFKTLTHIAQDGENGIQFATQLEEINTGLPIPQKILDRIQKAREDTIRLFIRYMAKLVADYSKDTKHCPQGDEMRQLACDAMVLGCILKSCAKIHEDLLVLEAPYTGWSVGSVFVKLLSLQILCPCDLKLQKAAYGNNWQAHGLKAKLEIGLRYIYHRMDGFDLTSYKR